MSKRRIIVVTTLIVVLAMSVAIFAGCGGDKEKEASVPKGDVDYFPDNFVAVDYSQMEEVAGMDSFDLLCETYDRWSKDSYKRVQYFSFEAKPIGASITNYTKEVYKIDGNKIYRTQVVIQDGKPLLADDVYKMNRFYYDGSKAKFGEVDDSANKTNIPGNPKHEQGLFYVETQPTMSDYNGADVDELVTKYTKKMCDYTWNDKKNLSNEDYKVYKDQDGNYRFTISISPELLLSSHPGACKGFEDGTSADPGSVRLNKPTTIDYVVSDINGVKKIVAWRRTEDYKGKKGAVIPAKQTCIETFSYDKADYTITDEDIA